MLSAGLLVGSRKTGSGWIALGLSVGGSVRQTQNRLSPDRSFCSPRKANRVTTCTNDPRTQHYRANPPKHHQLISQSSTLRRTALPACDRSPSKHSPGPSACDFWPADSDETNPTLSSAGVLDSQAQCQPHVTRRRALRDSCARASES